VTQLIKANNLLNIPGCAFEATALKIEHGMAYDHWQRLGSVLRTVEGAVQWWIGDWCNYGESEYGEKYSQAIEETGYEYQTLANYGYAARQVEVSLRRENVPWSHHLLVAPLSPKEQKKWLDRAEKQKLTHKALRAAIDGERRDLQIADKLAALPDDRYRLIPGSLETAIKEIAPHSVDAIITDPPYPREYLPLYKTLAIEAVRVLKPGGSMLVMVGQSYLPEILELMTPHMRYHWAVAYMTPGAHTQIWQREVMTGWKPVLWFVSGEYEGEWKYDVARSEKPDKEHHEWGQSESGMADLIDRFSHPGDTILDPFLGGGTTGVVAVRMDRYFIGIDVDEQAIETTRVRLSEKAA
jgi:DNA methylase